MMRFSQRILVLKLCVTVLGYEGTDPGQVEIQLDRILDI